MKRILILSLMIVASAIGVIGLIQAQIPQTMSYQGVLTDGAGGAVADGNYDITFKIYTVSSGGTEIWVETQTAQVTGGTFSVVLGSLTPLTIAFDVPYWLGVSVGGGSELSPRRELTSAAYSLNARSIESGQAVTSLNTLTDDLTLAPGTNISITTSNDSIIIASSGGGGPLDWSLLGNAGTTAGTNFLGTTDNQALEFRVNNARALRLEPSSVPNILLGDSGNSATAGVLGAVIGGGGGAGFTNWVTDNHGVIGGGTGNVAGDKDPDATNTPCPTVGGGLWNEASGEYSVVGGGWQNTASENLTTIGGGNLNVASGSWATIAGGYQNTASDNYASIGGGKDNRAIARLAVVGGGNQNLAEATGAVIGGGETNHAIGEYSVIAGGLDNITSLHGATVGGGDGNVAGNYLATVSGGNMNTASGNQSTVGGGTGNQATGREATVAGGDRNNASEDGATIGGGVLNIASGIRSFVGGGAQNQASWDGATIAGGQGNIAGGAYATIAGGYSNEATGGESAIGGGSDHQATAGNTTIAGGRQNDARADYATVGGGRYNRASGYYATVMGGYLNTAAGDLSVAVGFRARIDAAHDGAFLFADTSDFNFDSAAINEFAVRATGGVRLITGIDGTGTPNAGATLAAGSGTWGTLSDRDAKENFQPIDKDDILERVAQLEITTWNYKAQDPSTRHIGPMAQDFYAAFGLGGDNKRITTVDADGVSLAAIQALNRELKKKNTEIADLEKRIEHLESLVLQISQAEKKIAE